MRKRAPKTSLHGSSGESRVRSEFEAMGWAVSPVPQQHDNGTDLWLGARDARGFDLGALVGAQVKTGPSFFRERMKDGSGAVVGWWFRDTDEHADYWCDHVVPHIIVLHDPESKISYWASVTRESLISTGRGSKILVSASSRVDADHRDELVALAFRSSGVSNWEGSAWEGARQIPDRERLRYALMTPRLVAPHPNRGRTNLDACQAIALLVEVRLAELEPSRDGLNILDPELLREAPDWEWRFFAALRGWLLGAEIDGLLACMTSAASVEQYVAATACTALAWCERGKVIEAVGVLEPELARDRADPVNHGWLTAHLAWCRLETGRLDDSTELALEVYGLRRASASDPTARALAAGASYMLLFANDRDVRNLENAVEGNDTVSSWWRSQSLATGLGRQFDEAFEEWDGSSNRTVYTQDVAWAEFRSVMLQSGISADRATWGSAASLLARRELMNEDDRESLVTALNLLRLSGQERVLRQAIPRMRRRGPISPLVEVGKSLDLDLSTRTSLYADIRYVELSADVLGVEECDRHVQWALKALRDVGELERRLGVRSMVEDAVLDMLYELVVPSSSMARRTILKYLLALPAVVNEMSAKSLGRVLMRIPEDEWTETDIDALRRRGDDDHFEFRDIVEELLVPRHPDLRAGLLDRVQSGDTNALANYGNVADLPADVVAGMIDHLALLVGKENGDVERGVHRLGLSDKLRTLAIMNLWHPDIAKWSCVETALQLTGAHRSRVRGVIRLLEREEARVPPDVRNRLRPHLESIAGGASPDRNGRLFDDANVRADAMVALTALFPETAADSACQQALTSEDPVRRAAAVRILVSRRDNSVSGAFLLAVFARDSDDAVRKESVAGLAAWVVRGVMVPASEEALGRLLEEGEPWVGICASRAFTTEPLRSESAEVLATMLERHPSALVRTRVRMARRHLRG